MLYIPKDNYLTNFICSWWAKNALACEGFKGHPIATPLVCLYNILLNVKYDSLIIKDRRSLNSLFSNYEHVVVFKKIVSVNFDGFFKGDVFFSFWVFFHKNSQITGL